LKELLSEGLDTFFGTLVSWILGGCKKPINEVFIKETNTSLIGYLSFLVVLVFCVIIAFVFLFCSILTDLE